jgi:3-deoxy-D-manno-octulosonic-acid transferase
MKAPFGLRLYPLGQRRDPGAEAASWPQRPGGALAWLHVPAAASAPAMQELARRLIDEDGVAVLMTGAADVPVEKGVVHLNPPTDTPALARAFLDHWRPDIAVFSDGDLLPALIQEAADRRIPLLLADAREPRLPRERDSWFPGLMRRSLAQFAHVACIDEPSARAFRKAGAALSAVAVTGRMEARSAALPCLEAEREALARLLAARPVWFACAVPEAEETAVIEAQRAVAALAHRLLLILLPERAARAEPLARAVEEAGLTVALRSADEEPDAETAVFVVETEAELGLWYRLAPVTFLGGSLSGTGALRDPMEAAALGSAILHGPRPGAHGVAMGRLGAARAARAVGSPRDLAEALGDLLAPDRAARLAHAAWTVASDGAEATDALHNRIRRLMDGEPG